MAGKSYRCHAIGSELEASNGSHTGPRTYMDSFCDKLMTIDDIAILDAIQAETQESGRKFCKCSNVIAFVAHSQGMYTDELQNALVGLADTYL